MIEIIPPYIRCTVYIFVHRISKKDGPEMYSGMMPNISLLVMQVKKEITGLFLLLSLWRKSLTSNSSFFWSRVVVLLALSKFSLKAPYVRIIIRSVIICIHSFSCFKSSFNTCYPIWLKLYRKWEVLPVSGAS